MRVGLTGITGLAGWHIFRALADAGHEVLGLVREVSTGTARFAEGAGARLARGAFADRPSLTRFVEASEAVVHCGYTRVNEAREPGRFIEENTFSSLHLLDQSHRRGIPFVFISSLAVYNGLEAMEVDEGTAPLADGGYAAWKVAIEAYVRAYRNEQGLRATSLRPGGIYGLRPEPDERPSPFSDLAAKALRGEAIEVAGGSAQRTPVAAVGRAAAAALEPARELAPAYNLVEDEPIAGGQIARWIVEAAGSGSEVTVTPGPPATRRYDCALGRELARPCLDGESAVRSYLGELVRRVKNADR